MLAPLYWIQCYHHHVWGLLDQLSEKPEVTSIEWLHQLINLNLHKIEQERLIPNQVIRATCNISSGMIKKRVRQTQMELVCGRSWFENQKMSWSLRRAYMGYSGSDWFQITLLGRCAMSYPRNDKGESKTDSDGVHCWLEHVWEAQGTSEDGWDTRWTCLIIVFCFFLFFYNSCLSIFEGWSSAPTSRSASVLLKFVHQVSWLTFIGLILSVYFIFTIFKNHLKQFFKTGLL